jgi:hypothetical protein
MSRYACPPLRFNHHVGEQMARQIGQRMVANVRFTTPKIPKVLFPQLAEYGQALRLAVRRRDWKAALKALGLAGKELQRRLAALHVRERVVELDELAQVRTEARAQRRRPPRLRGTPARGQRCPHAPPATSAMHRSEVAA